MIVFITVCSMASVLYIHNISNDPPVLTLEYILTNNETGLGDLSQYEHIEFSVDVSDTIQNYEYESSAQCTSDNIQCISDPCRVVEVNYLFSETEDFDRYAELDYAKKTIRFVGRSSCLAMFGYQTQNGTLGLDPFPNEVLDYYNTLLSEELVFNPNMNPLPITYNPDVRFVYRWASKLGALMGRGPKRAFKCSDSPLPPVGIEGDILDEDNNYVNKYAPGNTVDPYSETDVRWKDWTADHCDVFSGCMWIRKWTNPYPTDDINGKKRLDAFNAKEGTHYTDFNQYLNTTGQCVTFSFEDPSDCSNAVDIESTPYFMNMTLCPGQGSSGELSDLCYLHADARPGHGGSPFHLQKDLTTKDCCDAIMHDEDARIPYEFDGFSVLDMICSVAGDAYLDYRKLSGCDEECVPVYGPDGIIINACDTHRYDCERKKNIEKLWDTYEQGGEKKIEYYVRDVAAGGVLLPAENLSTSTHNPNINPCDCRELDVWWLCQKLDATVNSQREIRCGYSWQYDGDADENIPLVGLFIPSTQVFRMTTAYRNVFSTSNMTNDEVGQSVFTGESSPNASMLEYLLFNPKAPKPYETYMSFPGGCIRWPYGRRHPDTLDTLKSVYYPEGKTRFDDEVLYPYCVEGDFPEKQNAYVYCDNDRMTIQERKDFCGNPLTKVVITGTVIDFRSLDNVCNTVSKICIHIADSGLTLQNILDYVSEYDERFTILIAPFNYTLLANFISAPKQIRLSVTNNISIFDQESEPLDANVLQNIMLPDDQVFNILDKTPSNYTVIEIQTIISEWLHRLNETHYKNGCDVFIFGECYMTNISIPLPQVILSSPIVLDALAGNWTKWQPVGEVCHSFVVESSDVDIRNFGIEKCTSATERTFDAIPIIIKIPQYPLHYYNNPKHTDGETEISRVSINVGYDFIPELAVCILGLIFNPIVLENITIYVNGIVAIISSYGGKNVTIFNDDVVYIQPVPESPFLVINGSYTQIENLTEDTQFFPSGFEKTVFHRPVLGSPRFYFLAVTSGIGVVLFIVLVVFIGLRLFCREKTAKHLTETNYKSLDTAISPELKDKDIHNIIHSATYETLPPRTKLELAGLRK